MATAAPEEAQRQMSPGVLRGATGPPTPEQRARRTAMLSVYYHSIGRRFEIRGAPAVLLPPQIEPQPLDEALTTIRDSGSEADMRQAIWTIARAVGPARGGTDPSGDGDTGLERYPPELVALISDAHRKQLREFDRIRGRYRREAHLFGAALVAYAESDGKAKDEFDKLVTLFGTSGRDAAGNLRKESFNQATAETRVLGGLSAERFLRQYQDPAKNRLKAARTLLSLEREVGLSLPTFVEEFADSVAFAQMFPPSDTDVLTIFPTSSVTVQDAQSLLTRVTVTALVTTKNFQCLRIALDPQCWTACSSAFRNTQYLAEPFGTAALDPSPDPGLYGWQRKKPPPKPEYLLDEDVSIFWGSDESRIASFRNVLNVTNFSIGERDKRIDLKFNLHRCIRSRILWDERAGGILVDEGYAKARRIGRGLWRLTVRKTLRFSDRTPYVGGTGWTDFGQILNYLAPSMLSWWIESEMYSATCPTIINLAQEQDAEIKASRAAARAAAQAAQKGAMQ